MSSIFNEQCLFARWHIGKPLFRRRQASLDKIQKALIVNPFAPGLADGSGKNFCLGLLMIRGSRGIPIAFIWITVTFVDR
jgi:hypothetical protein